MSRDIDEGEWVPVTRMESLAIWFLLFCFTILGATVWAKLAGWI